MLIHRWECRIYLRHSQDLVHYFVWIPNEDQWGGKRMFFFSFEEKQTLFVPIWHSDFSYHQLRFKLFNVPSSLISSTAILIASLEREKKTIVHPSKKKKISTVVLNRQVWLFHILSNLNSNQFSSYHMDIVHWYIHFSSTLKKKQWTNLCHFCRHLLPTRRHIFLWIS